MTKIFNPLGRTMQRRDFLKVAGASVAVAALPATVRAADPVKVVLWSWVPDLQLQVDMRAANTSIVDCNRKRAKFLFDAFDSGGEIGFRRHRAGYRQRLAAERSDPSRRLLKPAIGGVTEAGDVGASLCKPDRYGLADAAAGAGDQCDVAIQSEQVHSVLPCEFDDPAG